jgi:hypothetical protein
VAEAKFLRAHYYFLLVQMFGPIHLTLTETKEVQTTANRTPVLEVYRGDHQGPGGSRSCIAGRPARR